MLLQILWWSRIKVSLVPPIIGSAHPTKSIYWPTCDARLSGSSTWKWGPVHGSWTQLIIKSVQPKLLEIYMDIWRLLG